MKPYEFKDEERRREMALERIGTRSPRCYRKCNETDPIALIGVTPKTQCYEHLSISDGKSGLEDHHVAGRHNHPMTVRIPGNDHRRLNDMQQDWPDDTLRNPDKSPLLRAAACIRGWMDVLRLIIENAVGWIPPLLETVDAFLVKDRGAGWWKAMGC